ncbi:MAG TPA: MFS transporter [Actinomycetota bacterium]|nr:MFS transporter [Actinomycetota bacterium]
MERSTSEGDLEPLIRSRTLPLLAGYWSFGQFWGVWVILVLEFQRQHSLTDGRLGLLYSLLSISAIVTMLAFAPRLQRLTLRASVPVSLASLGIAALALAVAPTSMLLVTFVTVGVGNGLIDVYVNVAAQREETRTRRPILQWLHASYALGGVTGAGAAGILRTIDVDHRLVIAASGVALLATAWWNIRGASREPAAEGVRSVLSVSALRRTPALWIPALTVLFCFLVEGSMDIWSGLYLREELGASPAAAGAAFVAFAGALFIGRLFAAKVLFGLGPRRTIVIAGIGGGIGGTIAVLAQTTPVVAGAFLLMGFAMSAAGPAGFSLVEETSDDPNAIAAVATVGYTGFVWSPPLLGWIADTVDLRAAMGVIVLATVGITVTGLFARGKRDELEAPTLRDHDRLR